MLYLAYDAIRSSGLYQGGGSIYFGVTCEQGFVEDGQVMYQPD